MTEQNIEQPKQSVFKFAFHWGSIIGFFTLVYHVVGFYTQWDKMFYFNDVYFFAEIALLAWTINAYRKENPDIPLKFSRIMLIGFYVALIVAGFYVIYFIVRLTKLDPLFMQIYLNQLVTLMQESFNVDYSQFMTPQMKGVFKIAFLFSAYITSIISTMIYTLLLAAFITLNQRIYRKQ